VRIVSLVPSLTHTLCELGLKEKIVGCTKFCVHPPDLHRQAQLVGGTKDPDIDKIRALHPSHIVINLEENKPEHCAALANIAPCLETFPKGPQDVVAMLHAMGEFFELPKANGMAIRCQGMIDRLFSNKKNLEMKRYLYFIWKNPYMVAGKDTYISRMLEIVNWSNACDNDVRYPELDMHHSYGDDPEYLLLSSEPYPFRLRDVTALSSNWPGSRTPKIHKVDGMLWSWYGAVTLDALMLLEKFKAPFSHGS